MTIWLIRIAYWIPKTRNTHSEHAILIAFPRKQWFQVRASLLRYMSIVCLVFPWWHTKIRIGVENWSVQGIFQYTLVQSYDVSSAHQNKKKQFQPMYVSKQFSRDSLHFHPTSVLYIFIYWDTRISTVFTSNWTWRDTLPTHSYCNK
jgi:hypothetical protein